MHFVGLDLAWGEQNQTGVAVVDADGRLGARRCRRRTTPSILAAIAPYVEGDCLVAFDAPLMVNNPTGQRPARDGAQPRLREVRGRRAPREHRQARIRRHPARRPARRGARTWTWIPQSRSTATGHRGLPACGDGRAVRTRPDTEVQDAGAVRAIAQRELLRLMTLIEGLDDATPPLRVNRNDGWVELRKRVEAATQAGAARPRRGSRRRGDLRLHRRCTGITGPTTSPSTATSKTATSSPRPCRPI